MRPASNPTLRYTPPWVQDPDGTRRRPSSSEDVLQGAVQEWSRLLKETPINWQNEAVLPFSSALLPRRAAIHFAALGVAAPDSSLALLGKTLIQPPPWRLVPLRPGAVFFCDSNIFLNGWLLTARDGSWWATRPEPCPGQPYLVLSCSDIPGRYLLPDHFRWPPPDAMLCLRLLEKPCYDFVAPTSFEERRLLTAKFRHSRPGPSGWKLCFLEAFPDWGPGSFLVWPGLAAVSRLRGSVLAAGRPNPPTQAFWWLETPFDVGGSLQGH